MRATPSPPSESRLTPLAAGESPDCNLAASPAGAHSFLAVMGKALLRTPQTSRFANENATANTSKPVPVATGSRSLPVSIRAQTNEKSIPAEPAGAVPEAVPIATTEGEGTPPPAGDQQAATTTPLPLASTDSVQGPMPAEPYPDEDTVEPAADEKPLWPRTEPPVNPASHGPSTKVSLAKDPTLSESSTEVLITPPPVSRPDATGVQNEVRQPRSTADGPSVNSEEKAECPPGDVPPSQTADSQTPAPASESQPQRQLDAANPPSAPPTLPGAVCPIATAQNLDNPLGAGRGQVDPRGMGESSPTQVAERPNTGLGQIRHEARGSTGRRRTSLQTALKTAAPARSCSAETTSPKTLSEPIVSAGPAIQRQAEKGADPTASPAAVAPAGPLVIGTGVALSLVAPPVAVVSNPNSTGEKPSLQDSLSFSDTRSSAHADSGQSTPVPFGDADGQPAPGQMIVIRPDASIQASPPAPVAGSQLVWPRILSVAQLPASEPQPSSSAMSANTDWAPPAADQARPFEPQNAKDVRFSFPPVITVESAAVANSIQDAPTPSPSPSPAAGSSRSESSTTGLPASDARFFFHQSATRETGWSGRQAPRAITSSPASDPVLSRRIEDDGRVPNEASPSGLVVKAEPTAGEAPVTTAIAVPATTGQAAVPAADSISGRPERMLSSRTEPLLSKHDARMSHGTADAKPVKHMATPTKMDQIASRAEQKLPSNSESVPMDKNPGKPESVEVRSLPDGQPASVADPAGQRGPGLAVAEAGKTGAESDDTSLPARSFAPERFGRIIADQVATLKHLNATNLAVVIKPDAQTELRLDLRQQGAQVAVLAHCESASLPMFQAHWGQLQQALAAQGVILAPLNEPEHRGPAPLPAPAASFGDGQSHSPTGQGSGRRQSPYPEMMEETLPGRWTEAPPKPRSRGGVGPANGSLETWA